MSAVLGTQAQATQLVIDIAHKTTYSYVWLADQIDYLRTCGLWSTFDEMAAFAHRCIDRQVAPAAMARMNIDFMEPTA